MLTFGMEEAALDYVIRGLDSGDSFRYNVVGSDTKNGYEFAVISVTEDIHVTDYLEGVVADIDDLFDFAFEVYAVWRVDDEFYVNQMIERGFDFIKASEIDELTGLGEVVEGGTPRFFRTPYVFRLTEDRKFEHVG